MDPSSYKSELYEFWTKARMINMEDLQGWKGIINELWDKLEKYDVFIIDIKEKWGELRIHYDFQGNDKEAQEVERIVNDAIERSSQTCEVCGAAGELTKTRSGWLKTLCPSCLTKDLT